MSRCGCGRFVECEPDVKRTKLGPGDSFVIMGSDGLWDVMDDQTACDIAQVLPPSSSPPSHPPHNHILCNSHSLQLTSFASHTLCNLLLCSSQHTRLQVGRRTQRACGHTERACEIAPFAKHAASRRIPPRDHVWSPPSRTSKDHGDSNEIH